MQEALVQMADLLRSRAEVEFTADGLLVTAEGNALTRELIEFVKSRGLYVHNVQAVIAGSGDPYCFEVTTYRTYSPNELKAVSGFPGSGYLDHHPYAEKHVGNWWYIFTWVRDGSAVRFLLFKARSPFTWRIEGTTPRVWAQPEVPHILLDPDGADLTTRIQEFMRTA